MKICRVKIAELLSEAREEFEGEGKQARSVIRLASLLWKRLKMSFSSGEGELK